MFIIKKIKGRSGVRRISVFGIEVDSLRLNELLYLIEKSIYEQREIRIFCANVSSINIARKDIEFKKALSSAEIILCDGMGLLLGSRLLGYYITNTIYFYLKNMPRFFLPYMLFIYFLIDIKKILIPTRSFKKFFYVLKGIWVGFKVYKKDGIKNKNSLCFPVL